MDISTGDSGHRLFLGALLVVNTLITVRFWTYPQISRKEKLILTLFVWLVPVMGALASLLRLMGPDLKSTRE